MGWFDEQIRQREKSDQGILEDSFLRMAGAVLEKWGADRPEDGQPAAKEALYDVLKFYRSRPAEIPARVAQMEPRRRGGMPQRSPDEGAAAVSSRQRNGSRIRGVGRWQHLPLRYALFRGAPYAFATARKLARRRMQCDDAIRKRRGGRFHA